MPLDGILRNRNAAILLFGSVDPDQCVLHTLVDADLPGDGILPVEGRTATTSPGFCRKAKWPGVRPISASVLSDSLTEGLPS